MADTKNVSFLLQEIRLISGFEPMWIIELLKFDPVHSLKKPTSGSYQSNSLSIRIARVLVALALVLLLLSSPQKQFLSAGTRATATPIDDLAVEQALLDLTSPRTVMCVAAHPDDEDGATLTILRRKFGVHTVSLFSTYGEGGQNAIGPELYQELGAVRAQETLKAAAIQGSEPHFLGLRDFGFSKSAEETFRIWGHDEALRRIVLQIRMLQPDVIITNHNTTSGHGHHQATGRLVLEAFDAAADPKRFPEQIKTTSAWQVQRLFVRMNYEGDAKSALDDEAARAGNIITIDPNERDENQGSTYADQALHALQQHASQGPWPDTLPKDRWPTIRYRLARSAKGAPALSRNPKFFLDDLKLPQDLMDNISKIETSHDTKPTTANQRERLFEVIAATRKRLSESTHSTDEASASHFRLFYQRCDRAMAALSGIKAILKSTSADVVPNSSAHLILDITNSGPREATIQTINLDGLIRGNNGAFPKRLAPESTANFVATPLISGDEPINVPHSAHLYDELLFGKEFNASIKLVVGDQSFSVPVSTRVDVAPLVEIAMISPSPYVITKATREQPLAYNVRLINHQDKPFTGDVRISNSIRSDGKLGEEIALAPNESRDISIRSVAFDFDKMPTIRRRSGRKDFSSSYMFSLYPKQSTFLISTAETVVHYIDAGVTQGLRVGYVRNFDDTLRNALNSLGVQSQELSIEDIRSGNLQSFDTIIIDNRGYQAHPELIAANSRLMEYTKNGGTLVVFYHKANEWNDDPAKNRPSLAPFPITLGNERVTDENATVTLTDPLHPLLNTPNKIRQEDFEDWIQERGLYYPKSWDPKYQSLFAMSDKDEAPLRGGMLVADYGKGHYIYTSMVWYRQLRAGVSGGYRMFANMISYRKTANEPK